MNKTTPKKKDSHCHYSGPCANCQRIRPLYARRMCRSCCNRFNINQHTGPCAGCGRVLGLVARHMCYRCYWHARGYTKPRYFGECRECGRHMRLEAKHLCGTCYSKSRSAYGKCVQCGEQKLLPFASKTMCAACSSRLQHNKPQPIKEGTLK